MSLNIITAAPFEANILVDYLKQVGKKVNYYSCGIGCLNAARNAEILKKELTGQDILFVGSCGIFAPFQNVELLEVRSVHWLPYGVRVKKADLIEGIEPPFLLPRHNDQLVENKTIKKVSSPFSKTDVLCSSEISLCGNIHQEYKANLDPHGENILSENLELYSMAPLVDTARSFKAFLAVTNQVGAQGRRQWNDNFKKAAQYTAMELRKHLSYWDNNFWD